MTRFLRPVGRNFEVHIADQLVAIIGFASTLDRYFVFDLQGNHIGWDYDHIRAAQRLADGEFDNDFRFEIGEMDEDGNTFVQQIATPSQIEIYTSSMRDPYGFVQGEREAQAERFEYPELEGRLDLYAERGW